MQGRRVGEVLSIVLLLLPGVLPNAISVFMFFAKYLIYLGAGYRTRTCDPLITNHGYISNSI